MLEDFVKPAYLIQLLNPVIAAPIPCAVTPVALAIVE